MGRDKLKRKLRFKPFCKEFVPSKGIAKKEIHLLHEEIEALYLMDALELYQADAAKQMGVSRPTFARIIKSAREKVTTALISGAKLIIEDEKEETIFIVASQTAHTITLSKPTSEYFFLFKIKQNTIIEQKVLPSPLTPEDKPAQKLPQFFHEYEVNFFITSTIGEGLKNTLLTKGIFTIQTQTFSQELLLQHEDKMI